MNEGMKKLYVIWFTNHFFNWDKKAALLYLESALTEFLALELQIAKFKKGIISNVIWRPVDL